MEKSFNIQSAFSGKITHLIPGLSPWKSNERSQTIREIHLNPPTCVWAAPEKDDQLRIQTLLLYSKVIFSPDLLPLLLLWRMPWKADP